MHPINTTTSAGGHCQEDNHAAAKRKHLGSSRQYWRDIILGINDGLVSTFLLVSGVAGGGLSCKEILLTAVAGAVAGALSMFAGEYVATKSQNEVLVGEMKLEREHVANNFDEEIAELNDLFPKIGITNEDCMHIEMQQQMKDFYRHNPKALLQIMEALEFGVIDTEARSPFVAGLFSCGLFVLGSLPSVIPFIFFKDSLAGLIAAAIITTTALLAVGGLKTWATRGKCLVSAIENLVIAGCGGGLAYGVGVLFDYVASV